MASTEVDTALFDRVWAEAFEDGEMDVIDEAVASDYVLHTPGSPEPVRGSEAFKRYVEGYNEAFPDLAVTIEDRIVTAGAVVERFRMQGTHEGELRGIPATGRRMENTGIVVHYTEDGKAVESFSEFDSLALLRQLGVVDDPGE
jgi:steroid delta-isomerase-like uncharacterized protein